MSLLPANVFHSVIKNSSSLDLHFTEAGFGRTLLQPRPKWTKNPPENIKADQQVDFECRNCGQIDASVYYQLRAGEQVLCDFSIFGSMPGGLNPLLGARSDCKFYISQDKIVNVYMESNISGFDMKVEFTLKDWPE